MFLCCCGCKRDSSLDSWPIRNSPFVHYCRCNKYQTNFWLKICRIILAILNLILSTYEPFGYIVTPLCVCVCWANTIKSIFVYMACHFPSPVYISLSHVIDLYIGALSMHSQRFRLLIIELIYFSPSNGIWLITSTIRYIGSNQLEKALINDVITTWGRKNISLLHTHGVVWYGFIPSPETYFVRRTPDWCSKLYDYMHVNIIC